MSEDHGPLYSAGDDANEADEALRASRAAFLAASDTYSEAGVRLERDVCNQLAPYYDSQLDRAQIVQDFARALVSDIRSFGTTHASLASQVALVLVGSNLVHGANAIKGLETAMRFMSNPVQSGKSAEVGQRFDELLRISSAVIKETTLAFEVATIVIVMRQAELSEYLDRVPSAQRGDTAAARDLLVAAIKEVPLGALEVFGDALGHGTPLGTIVGGIIRSGQRVREKIKAVGAHYERGPLDEMFELAQVMDDSRQISDALLEQLSQLSSYFAALSMGGGGSPQLSAG